MAGLVFFGRIAGAVLGMGRQDLWIDFAPHPVLPALTPETLGGLAVGLACIVGIVVLCAAMFRRREVRDKVSSPPTAEDTTPNSQVMGYSAESNDKYRIFISVANLEHATLRSTLRDLLTRAGFDIVVQPDFPHSAADTVRKLDDLLAKPRCDLVLHLVGREAGSRANGSAVSDFFAHTDRESFLAHEPVAPARRPLGDYSSLTYFQWEPWLALNRKIDVLVYAIGDVKAIDFPQRSHLNALEMARCHAYPLDDDDSKRCGQIVVDVLRHFRNISDKKIHRSLTLNKEPRPKSTFSEYFEPDCFIGREEELTRVSVLVGKHRVVNLVGPGGSGKTWFANKVVHLLQEKFPDGSWVVELAGVENSVEIEAQVRLALGLKDEKQTLSQFFTNRQALLVLDNCERLKEGCAALIKNLMSCEFLRILTTSTIDLSLGHAKTHYVHPLQLPEKGATTKAIVGIADAVKLLLAHAESRGLQLTDDNAEHIAEICRVLDGMPLALKIVAARCDSNSPSQLQEIVASVEDIINDTPYSDDCERHRSVSAVVEWSYKILPDDLRELLLDVSIFRDGFSTDAVMAVCARPSSAPSAVARALRQLVDHSMIETRDIPEDEDKSGRRYRLLEPIRLFCAGKLKGNPAKAQSLAEKHRDWCVQFLHQRAEIMESGGDQIAVSKQIFVEHDNLRGAMNWCRDHDDSANGLRLAVNIWRFWEVRGFHTEGRREIEALIDATPPGENQRLVALAHSAAGMLAYRQGKHSEAEIAFEKAFDMEKQFAVKDYARLCMCKTDIANVLSRKGRRSESQTLHWETLKEAEALGNPRLLAVARCNCASIALGSGHLDQAGEIEELLIRSEEGFRQARCHTDVGYPITLRGWLAFFLGDFAKAATAFQGAYTNRVGLNSEPGMFQALEGSVWSLLSLGDLNTAVPKLQECLALRRRLESDSVNAQTLECVALCALKTGRPADALTYLAAAAQLRAEAESARSSQFAAILQQWEAEARLRLSEDLCTFAWNIGRDESVDRLLLRADDLVSGRVN